MHCNPNAVLTSNSRRSSLVARVGFDCLTVASSLLSGSGEVDFENLKSSVLGSGYQMSDAVSDEPHRTLNLEELRQPPQP